MIKKNTHNGSYGIFTISMTGKSPLYPVEARARNYHTVHTTVEAAVEDLKDRFGHDVVYKIKEEKK